MTATSRSVGDSRPGWAPDRPASMIVLDPPTWDQVGRRIVNLSLRSILILVAVILFVAVALGIKTDVNLLAVGLAFFAAGFVVPDRGLGRM